MGFQRKKETHGHFTLKHTCIRHSISNNELLKMHDILDCLRICFFFSLLFFYLSCPRSIYSVSNRFQLILLTVTCITEGSWLFRLAVAFWFSDYNRKQNYILLHNTSSNKRNICNGRNDRLPTVFIQKIFFSLPSQEKLIVMHAYYMLHALTSQ